MRKYVLIFSVLIATACLCACSSDDDSIPQINLTDGEIFDFFNSELREMHSDDNYFASRSFFYEIIDPVDHDGMPIMENMVYIINSQQELADIYVGKKKLPEIDFDKYTLIIGQQIMPYCGFYVAKKELLADDSGLILNLYARNDRESLPCSLESLYFWGLYPKLSQKTITVNAFIGYTNYHPRG